MSKSNVILRVVVWAVILLAFFWQLRRRTSVPHETIQVRVPRSLYRTVQLQAVQLPLCAFTGVSVTFAPFFLYVLGRHGATFSDWRVIGCFLIAYLVPLTYMRLGSAVLAHATQNRPNTQGRDAA